MWPGALELLEKFPTLRLDSTNYKQDGYWWKCKIHAQNLHPYHLLALAGSKLTSSQLLGDADGIFFRNDNIDTLSPHTLKTFAAIIQTRIQDKDFDRVITLSFNNVSLRNVTPLTLCTAVQTNACGDAVVRLFARPP